MTRPASPAISSVEVPRGRDHRRALRHRVHYRHAEALEQAREAERGGAGVERRQVVRRERSRAAARPAVGRLLVPAARPTRTSSASLSRRRTRPAAAAGSSAAPACPPRHVRPLQPLWPRTRDVLSGRRSDVSRQRDDAEPSPVEPGLLAVPARRLRGAEHEVGVAPRQLERPAEEAPALRREVLGVDEAREVVDGDDERGRARRHATPVAWITSTVPVARSTRGR